VTDRRERAFALLKQALDTVEAELAAPSAGRCRDTLGTCRETLRGYLAALEADALPPKRAREEGLGRLVADAWPFGDPVADAILRAERAFRTC
jgi:hypothetical protein